ncbi:GntR family transcriptional regulator [Cytobacillus purgationiresistens]|uniref:DNA-binding transcriptional regulator YhcF (GntR family) n=1 Tax=Cytobacillus purgationiresistens TaxID=863449 RepID=A0ABU0ANZ1_9BACI|nr:GntR family transcriptional regulator [Cytobacillus purgationiresistens]MDQ0271775.1 DNA-binding transcriptional regulator YhcF (GntR family) [Cytobacillus purgationiresistens]
MKSLFDDSKPIFQQIADTIADDIVEGQLQEGDQIPSTTELSQFYRINRATAQKAKELALPEKLPVMIFSKEEKESNTEGKTNITFYEAQLSNLSLHNLVILKGHHYLHWTQYKEMSSFVHEFTKEMDELNKKFSKK